VLRLVESGIEVGHEARRYSRARSLGFAATPS
jgi:hypothetical protein